MSADDNLQRMKTLDDAWNAQSLFQAARKSLILKRPAVSEPCGITRVERRDVRVVEGARLEIDSARAC